MRGDTGRERGRARGDRAVPARRHRAVDDQPRHPRFLGGMVRAVQAAGAGARQDRRRLCRQGRQAGQGRCRGRQADRRPVPGPVDPDRLCHLPGPAGRRPHRLPDRGAAQAGHRPAARPIAGQGRGAGPGRRGRAADRDGRAGAWRRGCGAGRIDLLPDSRHGSGQSGGDRRAGAGDGQLAARRTSRAPCSSSLDEEQAKHAAIARARAALEVADAPAADVSAEEARLAANPDDHEARFAIAQARMAAGDRDAAADELLEIIARDREWNDGAARTRFLQMLEAAGFEDPWGRAQRRRLSALLFT